MVGTEPFDPTTDTEARTQVRGLTLYEEADLAQEDLDVHLDRAKAHIRDEVGTTNWYTDGSLGSALVAHTAILAKAAVENYSLDSYSFGNETINVSDADGADQAQFQMWAEMAASGVSASEDSFSRAPTNTSGYIG